MKTPTRILAAILLLACGDAVDREQYCTIVYAANDSVALAGNNEDVADETANIQFLPAGDGKLGRIYFGFDVANFPQGGMNEAGLFFDAAAGDRVVVVPRDPGKPVVEGQLILKAMEECSTVDEVVRLFETYDFSGRMNGFYLVGDRFGSSVVIEPDTIIRKHGSYQIGTSAQFPSEVAATGTTDHRHRIASRLLEESDELSVDLMRRILSAVHWEEGRGSRTTTLYSYIGDLKNRVIYVYNFHDFEAVATLFPYETFAERRYRSRR